MADKNFAKYRMSFDDFISEINKIEQIDIPKNYIMIEHGHKKKKSQKQKARKSK